MLPPIIKSFNGDPKKFYPQFYKVFSSTENLYKNLSGITSLLLSLSVANHVLAELTGGNYSGGYAKIWYWQGRKLFKKGFVFNILPWWLRFWNILQKNSLFHKRYWFVTTSNFCHSWWLENALVKMLPFNNLTTLISRTEAVYGKLMKVLHIFSNV